jgi:hypothetical protein
LIEPIRFAEVVDVRKNTVGFKAVSVPFVLNTPPKLAYGKQENENTWRGNRPTFTFNRLGYVKGKELLDTIAVLAEQQRKQ